MIQAITVPLQPSQLLLLSCSPSPTLDAPAPPQMPFLPSFPQPHRLAATATPPHPTLTPPILHLDQIQPRLDLARQSSGGKLV